MLHTKLDLILPCYNPLTGWETNLINSIKRLQVHLPDVFFNIYLINDGSTKGINSESLQFLQQNLPNLKYQAYRRNQGKGFALRQGAFLAESEYCIYTDIDFPYKEDSLISIYKALTVGKADLAIGVRNEEYYKHVPASRKKIAKALRFFAQKLLHLPVNDTQAGLKGFNRAGREIFLKTTINRYLFDLEFISMAASAGLKIIPVEVTLKPGIVFSTMNAKILLAESYNFLKFFLSKSSSGK